jgi:glycosyltransferase involved in cell wall biosynthesis
MSRGDGCPSVTVCVATRERPRDVARLLGCLRAGTLAPAQVRVVDASAGDETRAVCARSWAPLRVGYARADEASAARQRNQAARGCTTELIAFCDDDVEPPPAALERLVMVFAEDRDARIGGVAGTIEGLHHPAPGRLLRLYYRLQAGYVHEHYGGHFFGPAINLLPTDLPADPELYAARWLNAGLVIYRRELFEAHQFPPFSGHSFQEDVHLSYRVGRTHELYFHRGVRYLHRAQEGAHRAGARARAAQQLRNRWYNATVLLGLTGLPRTSKFLLSVLADSAFLLRGRPPAWRQSLRGMWGEWRRLALGGDVGVGEPGAKG